MAMKDCSAVVHLGGLVGDPACAVDPTFTRHANIIATRMARDVAQSLGVSRFIFASSCSVYGCSDKEVQEGDALNPVSLYAQTKIDSEVELLHSPPDDFHVTILRFATVFGHSRRPRFDLVANLFTAQAFHEGNLTVLGPKQWRPFIHVSDLATAVVKVLKAEKSVVQNQIFNVGDESLNMTILQLAELAAEVVGKKHPVQVKVSEDTDDPRTYAVSFRKIQKVLGFKAKYTMRSGIEEMLEHLEKNTYEHFRNQRYSNVASTRRVVEEYFRDPTQQAKLYSPLQAAEPTANQEISPTQGVANL
jgi:nucleoside-diphosphate-sugar epimerase